MTTSQKMRKSASQSKRKPIPLRQRAMNAQRQRNRLYEFVIRTLERECGVQDLKRIDLASALDTDPSQITRWLSGPGNWELDSVSDLMLSVGGEMEYQFVPFSERMSHMGNFHHELSFGIGGNIAVTTSGNNNINIQAPPPLPETVPAVVKPAPLRREQDTKINLELSAIAS